MRLRKRVVAWGFIDTTRGGNGISAVTGSTSTSCQTAAVPLCAAIPATLLNCMLLCRVLLLPGPYSSSGTQGACSSCPSQTSTMKGGIERIIRATFGDQVGHAGCGVGSGWVPYSIGSAAPRPVPQRNTCQPRPLYCTFGPVMVRYSALPPQCLDPPRMQRSRTCPHTLHFLRARQVTPTLPLPTPSHPSAPPPPGSRHPAARSHGPRRQPTACGRCAQHAARGHPQLGRGGGGGQRGEPRGRAQVGGETRY